MSALATDGSTDTALPPPPDRAVQTGRERRTSPDRFAATRSDPDQSTKIEGAEQFPQGARPPGEDRRAGAGPFGSRGLGAPPLSSDDDPILEDGVPGDHDDPVSNDIVGRILRVDDPRFVDDPHSLADSRVL